MWLLGVDVVLVDAVGVRPPVVGRDVVLDVERVARLVGLRLHRYLRVYMYMCI